LRLVGEKIMGGGKVKRTKYHNVVGHLITHAPRQMDYSGERPASRQATGEHEIHRGAHWRDYEAGTFTNLRVAWRILCGP
jgi:hypothetical protein